MKFLTEEFILTGKTGNFCFRILITQSMCITLSLLAGIIRVYHECEGRIEKSFPRITVWHQEACRVMTNGDPEGQIFLSYPHTNNGLFFLLTIVFLFQNKLPRIC